MEVKIAALQLVLDKLSLQFDKLRRFVSTSVRLIAGFIGWALVSRRWYQRGLNSRPKRHEAVFEKTVSYVHELWSSHSH